MAGGQSAGWEQVLDVSKGVWHSAETAGLPLHLVQGHGGLVCGGVAKRQCVVCSSACNGMAVAWIGDE